jgi:tetratricopeptide (TPR) repeat protein/membrane protease YdiL (CAAX protease family)
LFSLWSALAFVFCYPLVLGLLGNLPKRALYFVAGSLASFVVAFVLVKKRFGTDTRRCLAVRRVSGLHLLLVVLLVPPLFILSGETANCALEVFDPGRRLESPQPEHPATLPLARTSPFVELDQMDQEMAQQSWWLILLAAGLLPALGEEAFCRGFLGRGLVARCGLVPGILIASFLFGLLHVDPVRIAATTVLGIGLHVVYLTTRSFWAPVVYHALHNTLVFASMKLAREANLDVTGQYEAPHLSPLSLLAAGAAVATLGWLLYRTRARWVLPDGGEWSPGYVTAEMPPARLAALPRRGRPETGAVLAAGGAYFAFAVVAFLQAAPGVPHGAGDYVNRGNEHLEKGEFDEALADYAEAIQLAPDDATAYANRGLAFLKKGKYTEALPDLDQAIRLNPKFADAYLNRAFARTQLAQHDQAIADYDQVLRINPEEEMAYRYRGLAYLNQGELDRAIADLTTALRKQPKVAETHVWRGEAYRNKSLFDQAIPDFTEAIQLEPKNAEVYVLRGFAFQGKGDQARAAADFEEAERIKPGIAPRLK